MSHDDSSTTGASLQVSNLFTVAGKTALVTGGGTGIGLMISRALAANGAKVYIVGRRLEVLEQSVKAFVAENLKVSGSLVAMVGDVGSRAGVESLKERMQNVEPALDLLINNAGISGTIVDGESNDISAIAERMWSIEEPQAIEVYQTNVLGTYYMSSAFLPLLGRSTRYPQIINISGVAGMMRNPILSMIYSTSKAAVIHLTKTMATELRSTNVRCNSIAPGPFRTAILPTGDAGDAFLSGLLPLVPAGRLGTQQEMATTILYLASEHQNYVNGAIIPVDGGIMCTLPVSY